MLLNAVIIVLRETLEAGILVSVLLSIGHQFKLGLRWLWVALSGGFIGAIIYAINLRVVSTWFDYVGQELVNAAIQYSVYVCLLAICLVIASPRPIRQSILTPLLTLAVVLASVREGTEIIIFLKGFLHDSDVLARAVTSGFIGLMIGVSVGVLCYYAILLMGHRWSRWIQIVMLTMVAAGMVAQATQLLIQADWLPSPAPIWDTRALLPESSIPGQLAYATFGYEATPTPLEAWLYLAALALVPLLVLLVRYRRGGDMQVESPPERELQ